MAQRSPVPVLLVPTPGREARLHTPEPTPELPSVGRAVASTGSVQTSDAGIAGVGGTNLRLR